MHRKSKNLYAFVSFFNKPVKGLICMLKTIKTGFKHAQKNSKISKNIFKIPIYKCTFLWYNTKDLV